MTASTIELATAVLDWARSSVHRGGDPYCHFFVQLALKAKGEAADDEHQRQRHGEAIARREAANTPWPVDGDTRTPPEPHDEF